MTPPAPDLQPGLIAETVIADLETPIAAYLKLAGDRPYGFLLESVEGGHRLGRFSVIGTDPDLIWRCRRGQATLDRRDGNDPVDDGPARDSLDRLTRDNALDLPADLPPMAGGLFGYLGYDMVRLAERIPETNPDPLGVPDAVLVRPALLAVFDHVKRNLTLIARHDGPAASQQAAQERIDAAILALGQPLAGAPPARLGDPGPMTEPASSFTKDGYKAAVQRARDYIAAGDVFQVVPSQRFSRPFALPPFDLYRALRRLNPSPFLFFHDFEDFQIVGSSPEILVRLRGDTVTLRPIAGTRRRGRDAAEDAALAGELLADPKEIAEHLMLLDLGRNDVGRVAQIGTVKVTERMIVERYSHVMHIVSNVEGTLRPDLSALNALLAGFPAGTVSGAPKVRAMEIIEELEPVRRGVYAGAVGYFGVGGDMDTCIALRTGVVKDGTLFVQAGGGIVADSDPEAEYVETQNKAAALMRAAEEAERLSRSNG